MAKKRKPMSEEQKQHLRDLAKIRYAKTNTPQTEVVEQPDFSQVPEAQIAGEATLTELQAQIKELQEGQFAQILAALKDNNQNGAQALGGKLVGTVEKYRLAADLYPSPVARLMEEPKLRRFAFDINYDLTYVVGISEYETIDHVRIREPKFTLELVRILMDEETGEPTNGRYVVCNVIMHEDPEAAIVIAREQGLEVEEDNEDAFLNEMRFIRMRDWLLECFYPAPIKDEHNRRDMVVEGKLVTYYEVNNETGKGLNKTDWDKAPKIRF